MTNLNPFKSAIDALGSDRFEVSLDTIRHQAGNGKTQVFHQIKIVLKAGDPRKSLSDEGLGTNTFMGWFFSEWMLIKNGGIYISADEYMVEYNCDYEGEDIDLVRMDNIHLPAVDEDNMYLAMKMAKMVQEEISKHFKLDHHFPIVEFDHAYPVGCR